VRRGYEWPDASNWVVAMIRFRPAAFAAYSWVSTAWIISSTERPGPRAQPPLTVTLMSWPVAAAGVASVDHQVAHGLVEVGDRVDAHPGLQPPRHRLGLHERRRPERERKQEQQTEALHRAGLSHQHAEEDGHPAQAQGETQRQQASCESGRRHRS